MKTLKFVIPLVLFAALAWFLGAGLKLNPREVPSPLIGKPAPEFALPTVADPARTISKTDLLGQVWVLNVWASWCVACREEHPHLVAWSRKRFVPIYGLHYKDKREDGLPWLARLGNPYQASLWDIDGRVGIDFGVYGVPETFVVDKQGTIRYKHIGPVNPDVIRDKLEPLIRSLQAETAGGKAADA